MPYDMDIQGLAAGFWAWLDKHPGRLAEKRIRTIYRKAHKQTMEEFAQQGVGGNPERSIKHRFSAAYGQRVTPRSPQYTERVRRFFGGRYLPFTSPTKYGTSGGRHLRDHIRKPGGYRVTGRNGTEIVTTRLYLGAARALNFHPHYRREFLALRSVNRVDGQAIEARVQELAIVALNSEINRTERRRIRMARAAAAAFAELR